MIKTQTIQTLYTDNNFNKDIRVALFRNKKNQLNFEGYKNNE